MFRSALLAAMLFVATFAFGQSVALKMPGPAVQNHLLGEWSIEVTYEKSPMTPNGGVGHGTETWRVGPGGFSLIEEYREKGPRGVVLGHGVAWWDEQAKGYHVVWCQSTDPEGCHAFKNTSRWVGNNLEVTEELEQGGTKSMMREVFSEITPKSFTQYLEAGPTTSEMKRIVTIKARRRVSSK